MKKMIATAALTLSLGAAAFAMDDAPFGTDADAAYAADLWGIMEDMNLVGADMVHSFPYEGVEPHGMMLETFYTTATVNGHTGDLIVKRNYGPEGVEVNQVLSDPGTHLGAHTVMFRREAGYDSDNKDWFWVKYLPDGSLDKNPAGVGLAGRVAKGADQGCIACHSAEDDYVFTSDHLN
ncbi:hypothetical protein [Cognatishimia maritima]|uniref:Cytochrome P460 n=1 Tax=Cognatishimia maritima TaxID=870908 RepID=A0A1M5IRF1_9RHOB|nr:hypothetical protein [Cognatishimia maritima]SHG30589.1 hypothetical protein SAMN04488044_0415 [Cognatishimia maritima]